MQYKWDPRENHASQISGIKLLHELARCHLQTYYRHEHNKFRAEGFTTQISEVRVEGRGWWKGEGGGRKRVVHWTMPNLQSFKDLPDPQRFMTQKIADRAM